MVIYHMAFVTSLEANIAVSVVVCIDTGPAIVTSDVATLFGAKTRMVFSSASISRITISI